MLEVEPHNGHNGQHDHTATGSGQNGRPGHIVSPASGRYRVSFRVVLLIFRSRDASSIIRSSGRPGGANVGTIRVSVATVHYIRLPAGRIHTRNSQHSVHLLSKHRVPTRLPELIESHIDEGWTRSYVEIPRGTYHVMFLVTLGLPYHSDVYLDKIELSPTILGWKPTYSIAKPTGNLRQFYSDPNGMCILFLSTTACVQTVY